MLAFLVMMVGASIQGAVGFGSNLFAAPLLLLIDPHLVPGPVILAAMVMNALLLQRDRHDGAWRHMTGANAGQVVGILAAALLVRSLPTERLAVVFGVLILVAVALSLSGLHPRRTRATLTLAGATSGFMGTTTGVGGPPIALVLQDMHGLELRASLARFFLLGGVLSLAALAWAGRMGGDEVVAGVLLVPGVVAGYAASGLLARSVDRGHVRTLVLVLSAASAVAALARALL